MARFFVIPLVFRLFMVLTGFIVKLAERFRSFITVLGEFSLFVFETCLAFKHIWRRRALFLRHSEFLGASSLGIISVAGVFLGAVLGYQLYVSFHLFGAEALLGGSVGVTLYRELAPVMTAIMVTGRGGAAMAAELASMRISEQIDALEILAVNPVEYLVAPRVLAGVTMLPFLCVYFAVVGSFSASAVACGLMGLDKAVFWNHYTKLVDFMEIIHATTKGAVFGLTLTWIGCFCGFRAYGGARAVGFATRTTVVATSLVILFWDYVLTSLLPFGFATLKVP